MESNTKQLLLARVQQEKAVDAVCVQYDTSKTVKNLGYQDTLVDLGCCTDWKLHFFMSVKKLYKTPNKYPSIF